MTMIAAGFKTKKAFREAALADPCRTMIEDPSLMQDWLKYGISMCETLRKLQEQTSLGVTLYLRLVGWMLMVCPC